MNADERRAELKRLFHAALAEPVETRASFLAAACAHDPALLAEVESLINYHEQADDFLLNSAIKDAAKMIADSQRSGDRSSNGATVETALSALIGTVLDEQYRIEALLGYGGMGAVYRARHILLDHHVAIKIMSPKIGNEPKYRELFLREGRAATRFKHANAVIIHDLRESRDGLIYLVLEYLDGRTLKDEFHQRKRFSPAQALQLLTPVASALDAAHARGVIHCDLKPSNIMITGDIADPTAVKLLDLGIARIRHDRAGAAEAKSPEPISMDMLLGCPQYMSPEQWQRAPDIDGRADLYSLAVIFYELISGAAPFIETTAESAAYQHLNVTSALLHKIDESVPKEFSYAIARAMAKNRDNRQASCGELIAQLRQALSVSVAQATAIKVVKKPPARLIWPIISGFIFAVMIGVMFLSQPSASPERPVAPLPKIELNPTPLPSPKKENFDQEIIWTPASRAFRNAAIAEYWEGQGQARLLVSNKSHEEIFCSVEFEFWFMTDKDGEVVGEAELLYDGELRLSELPGSATQILIIKPTGERNLISERNPARNNRRHYPLVGLLTGSQLMLALVIDSQLPLEFKLRADPQLTGGELIMRKISEKPFSPFIGNAQIGINAAGELIAQYRQEAGRLISDWRAKSLPGKQREVKRTREITDALARLKQGK